MCIGEIVAFGLLDRANRSERSYHTDEYNSQCMFFFGKIGLYQSLLCPGNINLQRNKFLEQISGKIKMLRSRTVRRMESRKV